MAIHRAAYRWTDEEVKAALRGHNESQISADTAWQVAAALGVLGLSAAVFLWQRATEDLQAYACCAGPLLIWLAILQNGRDATKKALAQFKKDPGADQMVEWEVSEREVKHWQRGLYYTAEAWKNFSKITEAADGFLLYHHTNLMLWLPFRAFESPEAVEGVRKWAQASSVPYKKTSG